MTDPAKRTPRIAVIGDIMMDIDLHCSCVRLCQEGPWPVFSIERTERRLGGAGNVARMTHALGAETLLAGVCQGEQWDAIDHAGLVQACVPAPMTTKTRYWVAGRMIGPRVDSDGDFVPDSTVIERLLQSIRNFDPDSLIVADHGKGFVTLELMSALKECCVPIYVDPVPTTPMIDGTICIGGEHEQPRCVHNPRGQIVKLGPRGLNWELDRQSGTLPSRCRQLVDPLGAGDQFIAALAYQRCLRTDWPEAVAWANLAAGRQCEQPGCVPLSAAEIQSALHDVTSSIARRPEPVQHSAQTA